MGRTEDQIVAQEPLKVILGGREWEVPILVIKDSREWRKKIISLIAQLPKIINTTKTSQKSLRQH